MKLSEPQLPLPTLPGKVHGIVGVDPLRVQCDGCGVVGEQEPGERAVVLIVRAFLFPTRESRHGRYCAQCVAAAGGVEAMREQLRSAS